MKTHTTLTAVTFSLTLTGCASATNPKVDPYEPFNRAVFTFNRGVDTVILKPVAKVYNFIIPGRVQTGVGNFFDNIADVTSFANDILQLNYRRAFFDATRVLVNTTVGVFGIFDIASRLDVTKQPQDFGLTLARWGVVKSAYFVIPFLGPSTIRDTIAKPFNYYYLTPWPYVEPDGYRYGLRALDIVNTRSQLLPYDKLVDQAFDPYIFVRNAYLQHRNKQVNQTLKGYNVHGKDTATAENIYQDNTPATTSAVSDEDDTYVAP